MTWIREHDVWLLWIAVMVAVVVASAFAYPVVSS